MKLVQSFVQRWDDQRQQRCDRDANGIRPWGEIARRGFITGGAALAAYSALRSDARAAASLPPVSVPRLASQLGQPYGIDVALFGDSRMNQCHIAPDATFQAITGNGIAYWVEMMTLGRVRFPADLNFGVSGERTDQILARIAPVLACRAGIVIYLASTNDTNQGTPALSQRLANILSAATQVTQAGKIFIVIAETPRGGTAAFNASQLQEHLECASYMRSLYTMPGVYVADAWPLLVQPGDVSAQPFTNYFWDGLHPGPSASFPIGQTIAQIINTILPPVSGDLPSSIVDTYSASHVRGALNLSPMMTEAGGTSSVGGSGDVCRYWSLSSTATDITAVASRVSSGGKNWQQIVLGGTPAGATPQVFFKQNLNIANFSPGDVVQAVCELQVDAGASGIYVPQFQLQVGGSSGYSGYETTGRGLIPSVAFGGLVRTCKLVVPATFANASINLNFVGVQNTPAAGTARIGRVGVHKVQ